MQKFLVILVMVSWCSVGFAISQQEFIDKYLEGRKLDSIEGVWITEKGNNIYGFYKSGSQYIEVVIRSTYFESGETVGNFSKGSENIYYGTRKMTVKNKIRNTEGKITVIGNTYRVTYMWKESPSPVFTNLRLWPPSDDTVEIASMIDKAKNTCKELGFEEGTEKFADCGLKLYSQSVELAAKQNQQIVMQPQSSGSNVMTIYDPVRDSNALMDKGMKMLTGRCTLGLNC